MPDQTKPSIRKITASDPLAASADVVAENIAKLKTLFPELITEGEKGASINVDVLKQLVGDQTLTDAEEKFGLNWHGKRQARQLALTPSTGTLRPCPDESVDWDTTQNIFIEGDNLEVLKLLQKSYAGRVKMIYIDPPYNTGKDFVYPDDFTNSIQNYLALTGQTDGGRALTTNTESSGRFHTDWLKMLLPRLRLARALLREDGAIFISIDENEIHNLLAVCNEVFGEENCVACITLLCNPKGRSQDKYFATNHEYVVVYSKSPLPKGHFAVAKDEDQVEAEYPEEDEGGKYRLLELRNTHREFGKHNRPNLYYPLFVSSDGDVSVKNGDGAERVVPNWDDGFEGCWTWEKPRAERDADLLVGRQVNGRWKVYRKGYASGADRMLKTILTDKSYFTERGQREFNRLFGTKAKLFQSPKSPFLLAQLLQTCTGSGDIVLDFFAGSGTLAHAIWLQQANDGHSRRFILVQLPEPIDPENKEQRAAAEFLTKAGKPANIAELAKERVRRAAADCAERLGLGTADTGFRVMRLAASCIRTWTGSRDSIVDGLEQYSDRLLPDRGEGDFLYELLLRRGLDLCVPIEVKTIAGKKVHSVGGGSLIACLDNRITRDDCETLALGITAWHKEINPAGETAVVFRDDAFADDVVKTNVAAILEQHGLKNVRSL